MEDKDYKFDEDYIMDKPESLGEEESTSELTNEEMLEYLSNLIEQVDKELENRSLSR